MEVRRLEVSDAELACETVRALKLTDEDQRRRLKTDDLRHFLSRPENYLIVAVEKGRPVGFLTAYLLNRIDRHQPMMLLYEIGVGETSRRQGIGTALINQLKSFCIDHQVMKMWVYTNKSNPAAMALYQRTGGEADQSGDEVSFLYQFTA
ncbi:MAG: GNAT family N-acetyltransferase [Blastocatellia bacterium]